MNWLKKMLNYRVAVALALVSTLVLAGLVTNPAADADPALSGAAATSADGAQSGAEGDAAQSGSGDADGAATGWDSQATEDSADAEGSPLESDADAQATGQEGAQSSAAPKDTAAAPLTGNAAKAFGRASASCTGTWSGSPLGPLVDSGHFTDNNVNVFAGGDASFYGHETEGVVYVKGNMLVDKQPMRNSSSDPRKDVPYHLGRGVGGGSGVWPSGGNWMLRVDGKLTVMQHRSWGGTLQIGGNTTFTNDNNGNTADNPPNTAGKWYAGSSQYVLDGGDWGNWSREKNGILWQGYRQNQRPTNDAPFWVSASRQPYEDSLRDLESAFKELQASTRTTVSGSSTIQLKGDGTSGVQMFNLGQEQVNALRNGNVTLDITNVPGRYGALDSTIVINVPGSVTLSEKIDYRINGSAVTIPSTWYNANNQWADLTQHLMWRFPSGSATIGSGKQTSEENYNQFTGTLFAPAGNLTLNVDTNGRVITFYDLTVNAGKAGGYDANGFPNNSRENHSFPLVLPNLDCNEPDPEGFAGIEKNVVCDGGSCPGNVQNQDYSFSATITGSGVTGTQTVWGTASKGKPWVIGPYPKGTKICFNEVSPSVPSGWEWSGSGQQCVTVSGDLSVVKAYATNTYKPVKPKTTGFTVKKVINATGDCKAADFSNQSFTIKATITEPGKSAETKTFEVSPNNPKVFDGYPYGTQVTIDEIYYPSSANGCDFKGVDYQPRSFTLGTSYGQSLSPTATVTNTYHKEPKVPGSRVYVSKKVDGKYMGMWDFGLTVARPGSTTDSNPQTTPNASWGIEFEPGSNQAKVTLWEYEKAGYSFENAECHAGSDNGPLVDITKTKDTPPTFQFNVSAGTDIHCTFNNKTVREGNFEIVKELQVQGAGSSVNDFINTKFEVAATMTTPPYTQETFQLVNGIPQTSNKYPSGTCFDLKEIRATGAPGGYTWASQAISPASKICVGEGTTAKVTVKNVFTKDPVPTAKFKLRKNIELSGNAASQGDFSGKQFTVQGVVTLPDGSKEYPTFTLDASGNWVTSQEYPVGSHVELTETNRPNPPSGYTEEDWGLFSPNSSFSLNTKDEERAVTVTNKYSMRVGQFALQKKIDGDASANTPGFQNKCYAVEATITEPKGGRQHQETMQVCADGRLVYSQPYPVGSTVTVRELSSSQGSVGDYDFTGVSVSPSSWTIQEGTPQWASILVTNHYKERQPDMGRFCVAKELDLDKWGSDSAFRNKQFTVKATVKGPKGQTWTENLYPYAGGDPVCSDNYPVGSTVTFDETGRQDPGGYTFDGVSISPNQLTITTSTGGGRWADVTATNRYTTKVGQIGIKKSIVGFNGSSSQLPSSGFYVKLKVRTPEGQTFDESVWLPASGDVQYVGPYPVGSVVDWVQEDPQGSAGDYDWLGWTVSGLPYTVTEGRPNSAGIVVTNRYQERQPDMANVCIQKEIELDKDSEGTAWGSYYDFSKTPFTVQATIRTPKGDTKVENRTIMGNGGYVCTDSYPVGSVVTVNETSFPNVSGYDFSGSSVSGTPNHPYTITQGGNGKINITVTNRYRAQRGGFSLRKQVEGFGGNTSQLPSDGFYVKATIQTPSDGKWEESHWLKANGATEYSDRQYPIGSVVTVSEASSSQQPAGDYVWSSVEYLPQSFTITGSGSNGTITVVNHYIKPAPNQAGFCIVKNLNLTSGSEADFAGKKFKVTASVSAPNGSKVGDEYFELKAGERACSQNQYDVGSKVTVTETSHQDPDGYVFNGVSYSGNPHTITNNSGRDIDIKVTNSYSKPTEPKKTAKIFVRKLVQKEDGNVYNQAGWCLKASTDTPGASITNLTSDGQCSNGYYKVTSQAQTWPDGKAYYGTSWDLDLGSNNSVDLLLQEVQQKGYNYFASDCTVFRNGMVVDTLFSQGGAPDAGGVRFKGIQPGDQVACRIQNNADKPGVDSGNGNAYLKKYVDACTGSTCTPDASKMVSWNVRLESTSSNLTVDSASQQATGDSGGGAHWNFTFADKTKPGSVKITELGRATDDGKKYDVEQFYCKVSGSQTQYKLGQDIPVSAGDTLDCYLYNKTQVTAPKTAKIFVQKIIPDGAGNYPDQSDWCIKASTDTPGASITNATSGGACSQPGYYKTTSKKETWPNSVAYYGTSWDLNLGSHSSVDVLLQEIQQDGYQYFGSDCTVVRDGQSDVRTNLNPGADGSGVKFTDIRPGDQVMCRMQNNPRPPTITPGVGDAYLKKYVDACTGSTCTPDASKMVSWNVRLESTSSNLTVTGPNQQATGDSGGGAHWGFTFADKTKPGSVKITELGPATDDGKKYDVEQFYCKVSGSQTQYKLGQDIPVSAGDTLDCYLYNKTQVTEPKLAYLYMYKQVPNGQGGYDYPKWDVGAKQYAGADGVIFQGSGSEKTSQGPNNPAQWNIQFNDPSKTIKGQVWEAAAPVDADGNTYTYDNFKCTNSAGTTIASGKAPQAMPSKNAPAPTTGFNIAAGEKITCVFTNTRDEKPVEKDGAHIQIQKYLDGKAGSGWTLKATSDGKSTLGPGIYTDVKHSAGGWATANSDGIADWNVTFNGSNTQSQITVGEAARPGYELKSGSCDVWDAKDNKVGTYDVDPSNPAGDWTVTLPVQIGKGYDISCTFDNTDSVKPVQPAPAKLWVKKTLCDSAGQNCQTNVQGWKFGVEIPKKQPSGQTDIAITKGVSPQGTTGNGASWELEGTEGKPFDLVLWEDASGTDFQNLRCRSRQYGQTPAGAWTPWVQVADADSKLVTDADGNEHPGAVLTFQSGDELDCIMTNNQQPVVGKVELYKALFDKNADGAMTNGAWGKDWSLRLTSATEGVNVTPAKSADGSGFQQTDGAGKTSWDVSFPEGMKTADFYMREEDRSGWRLNKLTCQLNVDGKKVSGIPVGDGDSAATSDPGKKVTLNLEDLKQDNTSISCQFDNYQAPKVGTQKGAIKIRKQVCQDADCSGTKPNVVVPWWTKAEVSAPATLSHKAPAGAPDENGFYKADGWNSWTVDFNGADKTQVTISEKVEPGYRFDHGSCEIQSELSPDANKSVQIEQTTDADGNVFVGATFEMVPGIDHDEMTNWVSCDIVNAPEVGDVHWSKVDDSEDASPLSGSVWSIVEDKSSCSGSVVASGITGTKQDGQVTNKFQYQGLKPGEYCLVETEAPDGYKLGDPVRFTVQGASPTEQIDLGNIVNKRYVEPQAPTLPMAGGVGTLMFVVVAAAASVGALVLEVGARRRKARRSAADMA